MVQVGYGYYGQCYELKRKKQADLLPNYNSKSPKQFEVQSTPNLAETYLDKRDSTDNLKSGIKKQKKIRNKNNNSQLSGDQGGLSKGGDFYAAVEGGTFEARNSYDQSLKEKMQKTRNQEV